MTTPTTTPAILGTTGIHVTVIADPVNGVLCYYNGTSVVSTLHTNGSFPGRHQLMIMNMIGAVALRESIPIWRELSTNSAFIRASCQLQAIALNDAVGPTKYIQLSANPTITASAERGEYRSLLASVRLWFRRPVEIRCDQRDHLDHADQTCLPWWEPTGK